MIQTIGLVPLDGSATAESVLPWAVTFARRLNLRLVLLQLLPEVRVSGDHLTQAELRAARHYMDGVAASLASEGIAAEVDIRGCEGDIAANIHAVALDTGAELILLGTHGRSGFKRAVLGSVAMA